MGSPRNSFKLSSAFLYSVSAVGYMFLKDGIASSFSRYIFLFLLPFYGSKMNRGNDEVFQRRHIVIELLSIVYFSLARFINYFIV